MPRTYTLYTYFGSSCSARVRTAAHLKGIPLNYKFIHLLKREQNNPDYAEINPNESVPTLIVHDEDGNHIVTIRQSVAILEYLEESRPETTPLLPPRDQPEERAKVRELLGIIACDVQPVTNLKITQRIEPAGINVKEWQQDFMNAGFKSYEKLASMYAGKYSVGDQVTLADCALMPAVDRAGRFELDFGKYPTIQRVVKSCREVEAFKLGDWRHQPDTPEEIREK